jgi:hypothetical protein
MVSGDYSLHPTLIQNADMERMKCSNTTYEFLDAEWAEHIDAPTQHMKLAGAIALKGIVE